MFPRLLWAVVISVGGLVGVNVYFALTHRHASPSRCITDKAVSVPASAAVPPGAIGMSVPSRHQPIPDLAPVILRHGLPQDQRGTAAEIEAARLAAAPAHSPRGARARATSSPPPADVPASPSDAASAAGHAPMPAAGTAHVVYALRPTAGSARAVYALRPATAASCIELEDLRSDLERCGARPSRIRAPPFGIVPPPSGGSGGSGDGARLSALPPPIACPLSLEPDCVGRRGSRAILL